MGSSRGDLFTIGCSRVYGVKVELLPIRRGRGKSLIERLIPNRVGRVLTNTAKLGTLLVSELKVHG